MAQLPRDTLGEDWWRKRSRNYDKTREDNSRVLLARRERLLAGPGSRGSCPLVSLVVTILPAVSTPAAMLLGNALDLVVVRGLSIIRRGIGLIRTSGRSIRGVIEVGAGIWRVVNSRYRVRGIVSQHAPGGDRGEQGR